MLLHCDIEYQASDTPAGWVRSGTLASLKDINAECLELFAAQAAGAQHADVRACIAAGWASLDAEARTQLCGGMVLLADPGFVDLGRPHVAEGAAGGVAPDTGAAAVQAAQGVMTFAWHLARCQLSAARMLLGVPVLRLTQFSELTLGEARAVAARHARGLQPRWGARPALWRALFAAAARRDSPALERARLHAQALIAAELRTGDAGLPRRLPPRRAEAPPRSQGELLPARISVA
ncbi:MAG: hypothetical protein JSS29_15950 [Proteobacteria bacterium]|nr:hypothetical protein [Pseudomonadota bacterium]